MLSGSASSGKGKGTRKHISGKQGRFFSCKQYEQALLSIMVCGMAMTRLYCEVTSLLIGNQVALFFAIAFQWLLISYCVRLPMILASRGCLLCFNLGFLCLACLARDVQGGIMGLVTGDSEPQPGRCAARSAESMSCVVAFFGRRPNKSMLALEIKPEPAMFHVAGGISPMGKGCAT